MDTTKLQEAASILGRARKVCVFTGAGVSAESGIPTFRDDSGLWLEFPPERFAHWKGLIKEAWQRPELVARFLLGVCEPIARAVPNAAHHAIAQLSNHITTTVVTQNIDQLHQDAGSLRVREVHGSLFKLVNRQGQFVRRLQRADLQRMVAMLHEQLQTKVTLFKLLAAFRTFFGIGLKGLVRPNIVLFNDAMAEPDWSQACEDAQWCEVMLVVGTSGQVLPAAMLPHTVLSRGRPVIEINPAAQEFPGLWLSGKAAEVMPRLVEAAFGA
jgi:NAD-dependent deacetylase